LVAPVVSAAGIWIARAEQRANKSFLRHCAFNASVWSQSTTEVHRRQRPPALPTRPTSPRWMKWRYRRPTGCGTACTGAGRAPP